MPFAPTRRKNKEINNPLNFGFAEAELIDVFMFLNEKDFKKNAIRLRAFFLDLIFPIECLRCGKDGVWLCAGCFSRIEFRDVQHCLACKKESALGRFCRTCRSDYSLRGVLVAGNYEDELLSKAVKSLKYKFVRQLSKDLGRFLAVFFRDILKIPGHQNITIQSLAGSGHSNFKNALIIPVPLHPRRERWRGFNQAELIARCFSDYFNLEISVGKLVRIKHRKPQTKLNKKDRKNNIKNCFAWRAGGLSGRNIILVDDVATTGSTLNECARVLKENGAGEVWGLVAANG